MGWGILFFCETQPFIAKACIALRSHAACVGIQFALVMTGFIDCWPKLYSRTLRPQRNYLK